MAIYDLGTASLAANGEVTGVGTTWKAPLTLIRVGATIVFKTEPVQIYTISEIISDTQINVYNPNSETVPAGTGYAILAHDGITVQGLAQDVAETLRYYQSMESEVATAVDVFKAFDQDKFSSDVSRVNTQFGEITAIGAQVSSDAAKVTTDKNAAAASATSASADKDAAAASAREAADYAASLDTQNILRKDLALSDLTDKPLARQNLDVYSRDETDSKIINDLSERGGELINLKRGGLTSNLSTTIADFYQNTVINLVTDYGLVGDFDPTTGVSNGTNNVTALQEAINDVISNGGNVTLRFPSGKFRFKRLNTYKPGGVAVTLGVEGAGLKNVIIEGDGFSTELYCDDIGRLFGLYAANNVIIRNMKVIGYGGGATSPSRERDQAFALGYKCKSVIFDNVYIDNFYGDCIYFGGDLENGAITGKFSRDVTVRNCILKERYGNGIRSWDASGGGTRSRLAMAVIDVVGLKVHDNIIYGEIDLEPNSSGQNMQYVEIHDNTFRSAGVIPVTNPYECEPLYEGTATIRGGVTLQTVASNLTTASITIRDNAIEYGRIRITGGSNAGHVLCHGNRIRRGGFFIGHYSGTNNNPNMIIRDNHVDAGFNGSDDYNMEDWITVGSIPLAAFFIQGSLSSCRVIGNTCGSQDASFSNMFYLLNTTQTGGVDIEAGGGSNQWVENIAVNTTALRNYTTRTTDLDIGNSVMPNSGVGRTEFTKQLARVLINPVVNVTVSGSNQKIQFNTNPGNKYRLTHSASSSVDGITGYTEEAGMQIQISSSSASASNTLTLKSSSSFYMKEGRDATLKSTRHIIMVELIEPDGWTEVYRNF